MMRFIVLLLFLVPITQHEQGKIPLLRTAISAQVKTKQDVYTVRAWSISEGWQRSKGRVSILRNGIPLFSGNVGEVNYAPAQREANLDAFNEPHSVGVTVTEGVDRVHFVLYENRMPVLILPLEAVTTPIVPGSEAVRIEVCK
jgi:hypothetical protein